MTMYADVIVNRKSPALDRVFTYTVPRTLEGRIALGMLVTAPFNTQVLEAVVVRLHQEEPQGFETKELLAPVFDQPLFSQELLTLGEWVATYYHCSRVAAFQAMLPAGMRLTGQPISLFYREYAQALPIPAGTKLSKKRRSLLDFLGEVGETDLGALAAAGFSRTFVKAAEKAGLIQLEKRRISTTEEEISLRPTELSPAQQGVYEHILQEWQGENRPFLLHGVTGSGKTEIYLRLIEQMAKAGKQSIVLVPEIALSTQMLAMLTQRLHYPMALLHSGLKLTERRQIWQDIAQGRIQVVVGARSAVFAPFPALGLIIIDEEQENSYKQDSSPRFSAIDVALQRAKLSGAHLVLGSATPSVERYYWAEKGEFALGLLPEHYYPAPLPEIRIVDMRQELRLGNRLMFSRALLDALGQTLAQGGQSILFLNRRGYYRHFACRDCGHTITCPHCAVPMSYHEVDGGKLKCHYCDRTQAPPQVCPACGSKHIRHFGVGTQRVEDELRRLFPTARIARLDRDVMEKRGEHEAVYENMRAGRIDFLVGTQMVAKGLDFPRVELAAVIAADTMLNLPDWRAPERTYQLITQLAGRCGRRHKQGLALIQTYEPEAFPIVAAANGDYQQFYQAELLQRELHGYPPFTHLIRLLFTGVDQGQCLQVSETFAQQLRNVLLPEDELCGPADAPLGKIRDHYRRQVLLKTADAVRLGRQVESVWAEMTGNERKGKNVLLSIDVDPMSMM